MIELKSLPLSLPSRTVSVRLPPRAHQHFCSSYCINSPKVPCNQVLIRKTASLGPAAAISEPRPTAAALLLGA